MRKKIFCRFCQHEIKHTFIDLGMSPLSNSYISMDKSEQGQISYPLHVRVCDQCFLVQLEEFETPSDIFNDYAYFSSFSTSWLKHAKDYVEYMVKNHDINNHSQVVEIASNDGYLLQYFKEVDIPVLGIEPAKNVAEVAKKEKGIPTISEFFGTALAQKLVSEGKKADLLLGNNVLAHVPDINDFVAGMKILLADDGIVTMEFPHLLNLIEKNQFDTIYHEHFSYLSFLTVQQIFAAHGLRLFDVQEWATHGGSLRIFACHANCSRYIVSDNVARILEKEKKAGLDQINTYLTFSESVKKVKYDLLSCLIELKRQNKNIVVYGAAAKGNTLLNYCGIRQEFIDYAVDMNPHKQNTLLPGSCIPVYSPDKIRETKPDYILILPWNLKEEIMQQLHYVKAWGAKFLLPIPEVEIVE
ncbi:class I SAM-dependent methyltransferase [Propionispira raffinosivorans]|uniref:class I SAM-dependent methyltransferase n=1 Tax=Propionispira raffinosivorans TaxID=86959 RepID=UPI000379ED4E|nr:class I SAM-dependent methyltransferase [Propionispira raffinosivorans]